MHELMGHGDGTANGEDQYILDTQPVRDLIAHTREVVARAASPEEALALCEDYPEIHLLLSDIVLPRIGGPELRPASFASRRNAVIPR